MRVAVVAGPDPGHAFPAIALCLRFAEAGDEPVLFTGRRWLDAVRLEGLRAIELKGLDPRPRDDDADAGARLHARSARMATEIVPDLEALRPDLVVADVLTAGGAMGAELAGVPWVELSPHPLYLPSKGLPPIGSGLEPGGDVGGRLRDAVLRCATATSLRAGRRHRGAARVGIGLPQRSPEPGARLIATIPALEVPRPDWPDNAYVVGPLFWEPTSTAFQLPVGDAPVVAVAPSTAHTGAVGMVEAAIGALAPHAGLCPPVRVVVSALGRDGDTPGEAADSEWLIRGSGRQDGLLARAGVTVCGGGHGMLAKTLTAGVPAVVVPGGGDQWELANRASRLGAAVVVRPLTVEALGAAVREVLTDSRYAAAAKRTAALSGQVVDPVEVCGRVARSHRVGG